MLYLGLLSEVWQPGPNRRGEHGQGIIEYGLILWFVVIALIVVVVFFAADLTAKYGRLGAAVNVN